MRNFSKFQEMSPGKAAPFASEIGIEQMTVGAVDLYLAKERETHVVAGLTEVEDLLLAVRLLPPELVAGKAEDR